MIWSHHAFARRYEFLLIALIPLKSGATQSASIGMEAAKDPPAPTVALIAWTGMDAGLVPGLLGSLIRGLAKTRGARRPAADKAKTALMAALNHIDLLIGSDRIWNDRALIGPRPFFTPKYGGARHHLPLSKGA